MRNQKSILFAGRIFLSALALSAGCWAAGPLSAVHAASTEGMSGLLPLGAEAPDFSLPDVVSGRTVTLEETAAGKKAFVVVFLCRHCPFVQHYKDQIARIGRDYQDKSVGFAAISANDPADYPQDAPESLKEMAAEIGLTMPLLFDESQQVAKAYTAVSTPDFFLFDANRKLVYRGQLDDSRPNSGLEVTGADARAAIDAVIEGRPVPSPQKPSIGCSIKWKR